MEKIKLLKVNAVKCLVCDTLLISRHRHDFVMCDCENQTTTDGGLDYQRVSGVNLDLVEITSEYEEITKEELEKRTKAMKERTKAWKEKSDKDFESKVLKLLLKVVNG